MTGLGTIVNVLAVLGGGFIGVLIKGGLSKRFEDILMKSLGLAVTFIGISGALTGMLTVEGGVLKTDRTMLMIFSLLLGSLLGEILKIEERLEGIGEKLKNKIKASGGSEFAEGVVSLTLIISVGAMAITGSLEDGLNGDCSVLFAKSMLDVISAMVFASALGAGVLFAAVPMGIYQFAITFLAKWLQPYLSDALVLNMSFIGSVLIFAIGINLIFGKKFKVGNMLPALFVPVIYALIF